MKTNFLTLFLITLFFLNATKGLTQEENVSFYIMDYIKVEPGMHDEYLKLEAAWKKIHQANIKNGHYTYWGLRSISFAYGAEAEYNYITRQIFKSEAQLAAMMNEYPTPEDLGAILTKEEMDLVNRTDEIRTIVKGELWTKVDEMRDGNEEQIDVVMFNYFDSPKGKNTADYMAVQNMWKPIHQSRMDDDAFEGWVNVQKILPLGSSEDYMMATVDLYRDMTQFIADNNFAKYFEMHYPGKKTNELLDKTAEDTERFKAELRVHVMDSRE